MKLPGPETHFHHNEPKLNQDWMLFSSGIEGGLCAALEQWIRNQSLELCYKQHFSRRLESCLCIILQFSSCV